MARNNRGRNNNPSGRNQYSDGVMDMARERPFTAAAVTAGAAAAGLFLWSKRTQIGDQLSSLSEQMNEWTLNMRSSDSSAFFGGESRDQSDIAEEALTLKSTGKKTKRPVDSTIEQQTKTGSVAY
ncbi:MAG: hypothetical protein HOP91_08340 [Sphingomonas sp.]|nr:hypothetical protein [Sphingomonas sp.]